MKTITSKLIFKNQLKILLFFSMFFSTDTLMSQCGNHSNYEVEPINENFTSFSRSNVELRLNVWAVRDDDGNNGISKQDVEDFMKNVADVYDDYEISFSYCVRELWDSYRMNSNDASERFYSEDCDRLNLAVYANGVPGIGGKADGIRGDRVWTAVNLGFAVHEIGHMFGLVHTFNGSNECPSQYCPSNPCNSLADVEIIEGDGLCDTPADKSGFGGVPTEAFVFSDCTSTPNPSYTGGQRCGEDFADPDHVLAKNFMAYYNDDCKTEFTCGQKFRMLSKINEHHSDKIGTIANCSTFPAVGWLVSGRIVDEPDLVIEGKSIEFHGDVKIINSKVTFIDCILSFYSDRVLTLDEAYVTMDGTSLITNSSCNGGGEWDGVCSLNRNRLRLINGSSITAKTPIVNSESNSHITLFGDGFTLNPTDATGIGIMSLSSSLCMMRNGEINGKVVMTDASIFPTFFPGNAFVVNNVNIQPTSSGVNATGFSIGDAWFALNNNSSVTGFSIPLESNMAGNIRIDGSYINGGSNPTFGLNVSDASIVNINNSYFDEIPLSITDVGMYEVTSSKFNGCTSPVKCNTAAGHVQISGAETQHVFKNNIIHSPGFSVNSSSDVKTKFLCNKFLETPDNNFKWNGVSIFQGQLDSNDPNKILPAGNIFSEGTNDEIGGNSPSVLYYYNNNEPLEILDQFTNIEVTPISLSEDGACGEIGPDWPSPTECPEGMICGDNCPQGIACNEPCPLGIDCTNPCPLGIICTEPCPPGIDCTNPCPPGIDCTEPCPPGIICTEPCPPGIDCTNPCPPNIDCTEPCPTGIICNDPCKNPDDCVTGCPLGIDCTVPCPPGIICTEPCPVGIDCTVPCPPGIDCTEPCPMGINCNEPCPPGVDCTQPCPDGVNCEPILCPSNDGVMTLLDLQYNNLENDIDQLLLNNNSTEQFLLDDIQKQTLTSKTKFLNLTKSDNNFLCANGMKRLFKKSRIYTEKEMVEVILANPITLYNKEINNIVFQTGSFKSTNLELLQKAFVDIALSPDVINLHQIEDLKYEQLKITKFALRRTFNFGDKGLAVKHKWLLRMKTFKGLLMSIDNYFKAKDFGTMNSIASDYLDSGNLKNDEIIDLTSYLALLDLFNTIHENGNRYDNISDSNLQSLIGFANSNDKRTSLKAKGVLKTFYDMDFNNDDDNNDDADQLRFLEDDFSDYQSDVNVSVFPNPSNGNLNITNNLKTDLNFELFDITGKKIYEANIKSEGLNPILINAKGGIYQYVISSSDKIVIKSDKLIILK